MRSFILNYRKDNSNILKISKTKYYIQQWDSKIKNRYKNIMFSIILMLF